MSSIIHTENYTDMHFMLRHDIATYVELRDLNYDLETLVYKYSRHQATKDEFLEHISNEICLMDKCKHKINMELLNDNDESTINKNTKVLFNFSNGIFNLFKIMFNRFPICSSSLKDYIDFCLTNNELFIKCKDYLDNITLTYQSDPEVYIITAMFMYEECSDIEKARQHFYEGLKYHEDYKRLHLEQFSMEIQHIENTNGSSFEFALENYYSVKKLYKGQMDFHFMLLDRTMMMTRVMNILSVIVEDMVLEYKHSKLMWQKLVQMNEKGFIFDFNTKLMFFSYCDYCDILNCILTYELGLTSNLMYNEEIDLWKIYLDHLMIFEKSYHMQSVQISNLINIATIKAFLKAHKHKAIRTVQYYIYWASIYKNPYIILLSHELIYEQLKFGFKILTHYITNINFGNFLNDAILICFPSLLNNTFSLWNIINAYMKMDNLCLLETLLNHTSYSNDQEMNVINVKISNSYLQELKTNFSNLKTATAVLSELMKLCPEDCILLYNCLLTFLKVLARIKVTNIRLLAKKLCSLYGNKNIKLWVDYIRFEYTHHNFYFIKKIFNASLDHLDKDLHGAMKEEYKKLKIQYEYDIIMDT